MAWDDIPDWSLEVAKQLLDTVKAKDPFTYHHCLRVGRGSRRLAKAIGLNEFEQAILEYSGLFHDIGKAQIPTEILVKPGRLDSKEIEVMKSHPTLSAEMIQHLDNVPFFRFMLPGIKYHHEKIEGGGYPHSLRGDAIPLFARVIAVVDSYDAMTNARPYRNPLGEAKAIQELKDFSGRQFDYHLVKTFLDMLPRIKEGEGEKEEVVVAHLIKAA
ncbi:MAG: HD domain-containing protein [Bdellovibrionales bacterium]|nr:HD domain-containing protein [Bdellovibrionales bacterium]